MPDSSTNKSITRKEYSELLNKTGLRNTTQRALIIQIIRQGKGHLDADEIHRRAKKKQPRLSLSTVYRTLQKLKVLDIIEELHFDEEHHHYEIKPPAEHHHLVCLGCGKIIEFEYPFARLIKENVVTANNFMITGSEVQITGYCTNCQKEK